MSRGLPSGSRIGGYELVRLLGQGGMGAVHEARDPAGRLVALKVLTGGADLDADARQRFVREARAAAAVSHPNVTRVHAAGEDQGRAFIVFELVAGGSLAGLLKKRGKLPWLEAVAHAVGIARGLEAIHAAGFVHRDLKPDNVLLDEQGTPKVSDLGLVRATSGSSHALTATGEVLGTPAFMAPEQIDRAKSVDARADVYALGATLFALVTGEPPFAGTGAQLLFAVLQTPPPRASARVPGIPLELDRLLLACLAKDPAKRPASASEVARHLAAIGGGSGAPAGRARGPLVLASALVLGLAVASAFALRGRAGASSPGPSASAAPVESVLSLAERHRDAERSLELAQAALERENADDAIHAASAALDLEPELALALAVRAAAHELSWELEAGLADATRALELGKDDRRARTEALAARAALECDLGRYADARETARQALEHASRRARALALAASSEAGYWSLWKSARADPRSPLHLEGLFEEPREDAKRALAAHPALGQASIARALDRFFFDDTGAELAAFAAEATRRAPRNPWGWFFRGVGARRGLVPPRDDDGEARARAAIELFHAAIERGGRVAIFHADLSSALFEIAPNDSGTLAEADRAIALDPRDAGGRSMRAMIRHVRHDFEGAREDARIATKEDCRAAFAWFYLGDIAFQRGSYQEAADDFEEARKWHESSGRLVAELARTYVRLGETERGRQVLDFYFGNSLSSDRSGDGSKVPCTKAPTWEFLEAKEVYERDFAGKIDPKLDRPRPDGR